MRIQISQDEITLSVYQNIVDKAEGEAREPDCEPEFLESGWINDLSKIRDSYKLLMSHLNTKHVDDARAMSGKNGLEVPRKVVHDDGPTLDNTDFTLEFDIKQLSFHRAKKFDATQSLIRTLGKKKHGYLDKTGTSCDPRLLSRGLWEEMDEMTNEEAEILGLDVEGDDACKKLKNVVVQTARKNIVRSNLRNSTSAAMGIGHVGELEGEKEKPEKVLKSQGCMLSRDTEEETDHEDLWSAGTVVGWAIPSTCVQALRMDRRTLPVEVAAALDA